MEPESERGLLHTLKDGKSKKELIETEQGDYMAYYNGINEAVINNKPLPVSAEEATNVIKVIEAAIQSNQEKKVINL